MNTFKGLIPILTAVISALAVVGGYVYQKAQDREAEIRKTRQEIYSHIISNITERNAILGDLLNQFPEYRNAKLEEQHQVEQQLSNAGRLTSPKLSENEAERTKWVAALCLYGTDKAIDAYAKYASANVEGKGGRIGELILGLRESVFEKTHVTADEADLAVWNEPKYLNKSLKGK